MVNFQALNKRLKIRLQSLKCKKHKAIQRTQQAIIALKHSFKKEHARVLEHHSTRSAATVLEELYDDHEVLTERSKLSAPNSSLNRRVITTYTGYKLRDRKSQFYVITPGTVKGIRSNGLSRNLVRHVEDIISTSLRILKDFNVPMEEHIYPCPAHPFFFYQCNSSSSDFIKKFNDVFQRQAMIPSPQFFFGRQLEHAVQYIPGNIIKLLQYREWDEIYAHQEQIVSWSAEGKNEVTYEEINNFLDISPTTAQRLATQKVLVRAGTNAITLDSLKKYYDFDEYAERAGRYRRRGRLNFESPSLDERREEALNRLSKKEGEHLTFNDISYVLGISVMSAKELSRVESREKRWMNLNTSRGRGHIARIPKSYVQQYIENHVPMNRGWSSLPLETVNY